MTDVMDAVKTEDIPPVDENLADDEKDVKEQDEPKGKKSEIVEGKREKKVVQRLNMQISTPKENLKIESTGHGVKLGDIARINHSIGKLKAPLLKPLHKIVYDRPGAASSLRKNLRLFNGFTFEVDSDPYNKKLLKVTRLPKAQLKTVCQTLDLERSGKQSVLAERIMTFLICPTNSGKPVIKKKKKKKTTKDIKGEKSSSKSKKAQKKVESGKSRAILTDSSSDDDDEDEDEEEKKEKNKSTEKSTTVSQKRNNSESQSSDKEDDDDDEDGEEEHDAPDEESEEEEEKSPRKKKSPAKKMKKSEQKSDALTDDSDQCSQEDKTVKKTTKKPAAKRKTPVKSVPKTKKADSSSNSGKKTASKSKRDESESSDDDLPLIKMIKKPPTDDQLKATIQDLLKDANLEEVTMKQLCRQVYDKYPDFDLTSRKDFIKETVKSIIS